MDFDSVLLAKKLGGGGGGGMTPQLKNALLGAFSKVAWIDENGQDYYDTLLNAMYSPADLSSITAVYSGSSVTALTPLDDLKTDLVVTAHWSDESTSTVSADYYTLSGTLVSGSTSTITVTYLGKTTTFTVTVTGGSDMHGWTDGIAYTNLEIIENSYYSATTGAPTSYSGWDRTGYVPCHGASTIVFPILNQEGTSNPVSNGFFDENHNKVGPIALSRSNAVTLSVPSDAYYFGISSNSSALADCVATGIVPHA